jgi:signal transduction histidine kinase
MRRWSTAVSPLAQSLQSASLLAVLAGYGILLMFNQVLAREQRLQSHNAVTARVLSIVATRAKTPEEALEAARQAVLPDMRVSIVGAADRPLSTSEQAEQDNEGRQWLVSTATLQLVHGPAVSLRIEQDVSASVAQERQTFWLLVAAAGASSLFTGTLIRVVLNRGLVKPLDAFSQQVRGFRSPPSPDDAIAIERLPAELRPIALAFNGLQTRLYTSWERQRAFVDGVAHELRTPITLISGHAQRLSRLEASSDHSHGLRLMQDEAERMRTLVSDLLDLARSDSGRLNLARQELVPDDILIELFERLENSAAGRLRLDLDTSSNAEVMIQADPHRLQQCLTTLVENALHYAPAPGLIRLRWSLSSNASVILHVIDEGPGVPFDERQRIFERFVRGSAGLACDSRGSGIGLSVVKLLIEAMGGTVCVVDAPEGGGADFQLELRTLKS